MAKPEEFSIHIEPDGRILLEGKEMNAVSYRRLVELLEETVGKGQEVTASDDPTPGVNLARHAEDDQEKETLKLGKKS